MELFSLFSSRIAEFYHILVPIAPIFSLSPPSRAGLSQLNPFNRHNFAFDPSVTPLANPGSIVIGWLIYHTAIWSLAALLKCAKLREENAKLSKCAKLREEKPKFRRATALHNAILALFSLFVFLGAGFDTFSAVFFEGGWEETMCRPVRKSTENAEFGKGALFYWGYIFYLSKYYEFIDTILLVLKRKPLNFLHVYHHTIVVFMMWTFFPHNLGLVSFGVVANSLVHVVMYTYFALSALGVTAVHRIRRGITSLQILQFVWSFLGSLPYLGFAVGIIGSGSQIISNNANDNDNQGSQIDSDGQGSQFLNGWEFEGCAGGPAFAFGSLVNASFLALFYRFYRGAYGKKVQKNEKKE